MEKPFANEEKIVFQNAWPCRLRTLDIAFDFFPYPHYASTVEMMLVERANGTVWIGTQRFEVKATERAVFFVAPNVIHYTEFQKGEGQIHVFKISPELLSIYMNLNAVLSAKGYSLYDIPMRVDEAYDEIHGIAFERISYDGDPFRMISGLSALFSVFDRYVASTSEIAVAKPTNEKISMAISWMQKHVCEQITVADAARELHYSKYYFCRKFKEYVGVSFSHYLNILKINHAIECMKQGHSATYCCYECGFGSLSHFLKLFREITGYTTSEYRALLHKKS